MEKLIRTIIQEHGTPFYLFNERGFMDNYISLNNTIKQIYPNYQISYSYKTNYTPYICNIVKRLGGFAEVVSDMEYLLAKKLGYQNSEIVYNGPSKGDYIFEHLENGGILNIDSLDEAKRIVSYCNSHKEKKYSCGLRVNISFGDGFISRFGIVPESADWQETVALIKSSSNLDLVGLHCHISRHRGLDAWQKRANYMIEIADKYIDGIPQYISLGSGMFADMPPFLKEQFGGDSVPSYKDYAECVFRPFANRYANCSQKPIVFTEPGTTLVARYMDFVTKVISIKTIGRRNIANMDGDFHNLGEICTLKQLPTSIIRGGSPTHIYPNLDIMGFTCLEQDVLYKSFEEPLAANDYIVFNNVGGYSIVSKPQFIKPQCAMFTITDNGEIKTIMREETFDDVFNKFSFQF